MAKHTLVIAEKPDAARQIAIALDLGGNPQRLRKGPMPYYVARRKREIIVVPALGHLYTVAAMKGLRKSYPIFDFEWQPKCNAYKANKHTRAWIDAISKLADDADEFIDACDYDIEGSVIGYNILKYACGGKENEAKRMKYSTLTREELAKSYEERLPNLDFPWIKAGLARHEIDWLYGINLSRALMSSVKRASQKYFVLSTGRVQGPTLKLVADREREINSFVPLPYWVIRASVKVNGQTYEALYEKNVKAKNEAFTIAEACKGKKGIVKNANCQRFLMHPPVPFDLGDLQAEAFRLFKCTPKRTSDIAQHLYLDALISYPRTESQKLPPSINFREILHNLSRFSNYRRLAEDLMARPHLIPREGKKRDPAHPAIYPTGKHPARKLSQFEARILDLVVRRFMTTFGSPAKRQRLRITVDIAGYHFRLNGTNTLDGGWLRFYQPYVRLQEETLPPLAEADKVNIKTINVNECFTQPPPRYNPGSLLEQMEKSGIGTKATRGGIIQILYDRKYIVSTRIATTDLGLAVLEVLEKHCPAIISAELTRKLEKKMDSIKAKNERREKVLHETTAFLMPLLEAIKQREKQIGSHLSEAIGRLSLEERTIGVCPTCKTGRLLMLRSRKTGKRFVGCSNYFKGKCRTAFPLPQKGFIKPYTRNCSCGLPKIRIQTKNRRVWVTCIDPACHPSQENRAIEM